jgi:tripartite-type tricarboxylate transporter receptor subunit TctC
MTVVRTKFLGAGLSALIGAGVMLAGPAVAQDGFYAGKTVTVVVGFTAGGGYDQYARTFARHVLNHIPGKPNVIVQNMPGAGSLTAVRYIDGPAAKDGTIIVAFNPGVITDSLTNPEKIKVKFTEFGWLGSITRDARVCYAWNTSPTKSMKDLLEGKQFIMGATGLNTSNYVNGAVLRNLFSLNIKQITGFPGSNEVRLAIERGELYGDCGSWSSIPDDWIKNKRIVPFVSFTSRRLPDMPSDLPFIGDFAKTEEQREVLNIVIAAGELGRPFVVSKQVPADRLALLRKAFDATMKDQAFVADATKQGLPVDPATGDEAQKILERIYAAKPEFVAKAKDVMK